MTISPQSLCSIAVKYGLQVSQTAVILARKLMKLGATYIVDSSYARYLSLSYIYEEFKKKNCADILITSVCPGFGQYSPLMALDGV